MTGWLRIVGLGPGAPGARTPDAEDALNAATDLIGYAPYLERFSPRAGQIRHATDNREELARARHALTLGANGHRAALVSGGDPGVFAMASAVFEALESGPASWRALDITVIPGITAMLAAAAHLGAPLGHDFCAISLSDNLKPWALVLQRLTAAAGAGFVIAVYNPRSRARPDHLREAFTALRKILPPATPVAFAAAITRPDEHVTVTTLEAANPEQADMRTLVLIGSHETRVIARENAPPFLYTPRSTAA